MQELEAAFRVGRFDVLELARRSTQCSDGMTHEEAHAVRLAVLDELAREPVRVAGFVLRRIRSARELRRDVAQRRLDRQGLVDSDQAAVAAERAHLRCGSLGGRELCGARIEMQDALRALVVVDADVAAQLLQHLAAVGA